MHYATTRSYILILASVVTNSFMCNYAAQFELDSCTHVLVELLEKFCAKFTSCEQCTHISHYVLYSTQAIPHV